MATYWNKEIEEWKNDKFDTAALSFCRRTGLSESKRYPVVFPVKLQKNRFDWTEAWIKRAISKGYVSRGLLPKIRSKLRLPFAEAFSDLHNEAKGLESLELDALHGWLRERLDRQGQNIEIAGIGMPRHLLRSVGLFLILIVQGYAARHVSEAASRMETSADGDPGAFQAWIMLYDGPLSRFAVLCIVGAPTAIAATILFYLESGGLPTANSFVSGLACLASLLLATYSIQNALRLRAAARRHQKSLAPDRADESS